MSAGVLALALASGFVLGSIPFGLLLARLVGGDDPRSVGSGNIGATNVARSGGLAIGVVTLALDAAKGLLPVVLLSVVEPAAAAAAGFAAVVGHCFPPWLRFRGGKGVATYLGVSLGLAFPWGALAFALTWSTTLALTRYASLASLAAVTLVPPVAWLTGAPWPGVAALAGAALVSWWRHRGNLSRLLAGREHRVGAARQAGPMER